MAERIFEEEDSGTVDNNTDAVSTKGLRKVR
jgi:hypothetical protein